MDYPEQGYAEARFTSDIDDDLLCAICLNVLREPLQCVKNEHHFCAPCIKRHLNNTPKCPSCMEDLSVGTLRKPARYLTKHLSSLQIKCDYEGRGCREFVKLEQLQYHLEGCGYKPVPCDGCGQMVNRGEMMKHETKTCPVKTAKCHDCTSIKKDVGELKEIVKKNESMKKEIDELKVAFLNLGEMVRKEVHGVKDCLEQFKENQATGILRSVHVEEPPLEEAIVVIGGYDGRNRLMSAEMYLWSKQKWVPFPSTSYPRSGSAAAVYQNQILVTGGKNNDETLTDSIEAIQIIDGKPGQWYEKPYSLPDATIGHCCIVYENRLIVVGGCKHDQYSVSDDICWLPLGLENQGQWTHSLNMSNPRCFHGVELFGDNLVIIGGARESQAERLSRFEPSVRLLDLKTNTLQEISALRSCITGMATVPWGDHIVLLGGRSPSGETLNTAKMYNIKTGKMYQLPPMKYKRYRCTAVALHNSIVVIGGRSKFLNTVECFSFANYTWSELPPMNNSRISATSVVVPIKTAEVI